MGEAFSCVTAKFGARKYRGLRDGRHYPGSSSTRENQHDNSGDITLNEKAETFANDNRKESSKPLLRVRTDLSLWDYENVESVVEYCGVLWRVRPRDGDDELWWIMNYDDVEANDFGDDPSKGSLTS